MSAESWNPDIGQFPYPPPNPQVVSPMFVGALDIRWDDPSILNTGPNCPKVQACATITLTGAGAPDTLIQATGDFTIATAPLPVGATVTIGGIVLTNAGGPRTPGSNNFDGSLGTAALIAADIQDALNDAANTFDTLVSPLAVGATVDLVAVSEGTDGNSVTLATNSPADIVLSGTGLTGGVDADTITIGGVATLTAVTGPRTSGVNDFSVDGTTFDIAQSIADAINDPANVFGSLVTATASYGEVTLIAVPLGVKGNAITLEATSSLMVLSGDCLSGGQGTFDQRSETWQNNSQWNIVGVNVYRSDTGERGPFFRLNDIPVGTNFFRDWTDNVYVEDEIVDWNSQWVSKGDTSNDRRWQFCVRSRSIVKAVGQAIHGNAPSDVRVTIDGVQVPVENVFGTTGVITLVNVPAYDLATERTFGPVLPKEDGSSAVLVSYHYNRNLVKTDLEHKAKVFYRLTTVAVDASTPSGLTETPLGWSPPKSVMEVETTDYIWREAVRRNNWVLQQGGERVKLFIRRMTGVACPCRINERTGEYGQMPFGQGGGPRLGQATPLGGSIASATCTTCFGTGWVQGYEGPIDIIIAPDDAERRVAQTPIGRRLEHAYEVWTGPSPMLSQRDFIVKQTGERYSIGPVRRPSNRGLPLQQHFGIGYLDEQDIRYRVPVNGITELPWPMTRTTDERTVCHDADPHPVGFDYQASTMETDKDNIPDEREQRGRTPVWENINY
jgi:hypothetical protein